MPFIRWIGCILVLAALLPAAAFGNSSPIEDALQKSAELKEQERYLEAVPHTEEALKLGVHEFGLIHPLVAKLLSQLAGLYAAAGQYGDAEPFYQRALEVQVRLLGPDHLGVAASLSELALNDQAQGRYGEAEAGFLRTLAIVEKTHGPTIRCSQAFSTAWPNSIWPKTGTLRRSPITKARWRLSKKPPARCMISCPTRSTN